MSSQLIKFKTYQEVLDYLYVQLPMFQKVGASAYKKDLDNTLKLLAALGNPETKFKTIHVAGTNGKGSSSHYLSAILQEAGYKTGLYTSPHLKNFTERIKLNGIEMPQNEVVDFMNRALPLLAEIKPSFFEFTVAMAFDYFAQKEVDIAVIEVGMGGRLDSTNVIQPEVSLITNISFDHQQWLGSTLAEIAGEKAGIIKKDTPVVVSEKQESITRVFEDKAAQMKAPLSLAADCYTSAFDGDNLMVKSPNDNSLAYSFHLPQAGLYQTKNIPGVLTVVDALKKRGFSINDQQVKTGIEQMKKLTGLKGRWQILSYEPLTICDVGHNEAGIKFIVDQLSREQYGKLHMVWGTVNDKDISKVLEMLPKEADYYFCKAEIPRALDAKELGIQAAKHGLKGQVVPKVSEAISMARRNAAKNDLIFIGGSTFVVAEIDNL
ncbi:bifunctional folylpolyglutamate synthase/dihydrofolate synthase [Fulvivirga maritima]|uniref:bifunctional folylpolyglutamate synthase/dihydrofolate synthase n=1 Tax=Fulvivirga maritima TaxID=2904247 RepID=UPI001F43B0E7|nr:folylpolyglutamate synthase/dihydrofolate synthase family protein [Fulvivirga maritima]UII25252.1 bifunctional folylpolyglutamate synthase/dihydrofolate synthase [Fulvivirga maritima]